MRYEKYHSTQKLFSVHSLGEKVGSSFLIIFFLLSTLFVSPESLLAETVTHQKPSVYSISQVNQIHIPKEFGIVEEVYHSSSPAKNNPMIVYLQDAHCIYEAQSNIRKIIDTLQKKNGLRLIALEGGEGGLDTDLFRSFPVQAVKEKVIDDYVRRGELSGAEYAAIVNEKSSDYWGIEDMVVYYENKNAFLESIDDKKRIDLKLDDLDRWLKKKKDEIYSNPLKDNFKEYEAYEKEYITLLDYLNYLKEQWIQAGKSLTEFASIQTLLEAINREKQMDFTQVQSEAVRLEKVLERRYKSEIRSGSTTSKVSFQDLEARRSLFGEGKSQKDQFYPWIWARVIEEDLVAEDSSNDSYPHFLSYIKHLQELENIKGESLFNELEKMNQGIKDSLFQNEEQRTLDQLFYNLKILRNLSKLELTREELEYYHKNRESLSEKSFWDFMGRELGRLELDDLFKSHERFYEAAIKRDRILYQNLMDLLKEKKQDFAMVVTGGFHTDGIKERLKAKGFSYMVVTPRITQFDEETPYWDVMQGNVSYAKYKKTFTLAPELALQVYNEAIEAAIVDSFVSAIEADLPEVLNSWRDNVLTQDLDREVAAQYTTTIDRLIDRLVLGLEQTQINPELIQGVSETLRLYLQGERDAVVQKVDQLQARILQLQTQKVVSKAAVSAELGSSFPEFALQEGVFQASSLGAIVTISEANLSSFNRLLDFVDAESIRDFLINTISSVDVESQLEMLERLLTRNSGENVKIGIPMTLAVEQMVAVYQLKIGDDLGGKRNRDLVKISKLEMAKNLLKQIKQTKDSGKPLSAEGLELMTGLFNMLQPMFDRTGANLESMTNVLIRRDDSGVAPFLSDNEAVFIIDHIYPISFINKKDPTYLLGDALIAAQKAALIGLKNRYQYEVDVSSKRGVVFGIQQALLEQFHTDYLALVQENLNKTAETNSKLKVILDQNPSLLSDRELFGEGKIRAKYAYKTGAQINELIPTLGLGIQSLQELGNDKASENIANKISKLIVPELEDIVEEVKLSQLKSLNILNQNFYNLGRIPSDVRFNAYNRRGPPRVNDFSGLWSNANLPGIDIVVGELLEQLKKDKVDDKIEPLLPEITDYLIRLLEEALAFTERNPRHHLLFNELFFTSQVRELLQREFNPNALEEMQVALGGNRLPERLNHKTFTKGDEHFTLFRDQSGKVNYLFVDFDNFQVLDLLQRQLNVLPNDDGTFFDLHAQVDLALEALIASKEEITSQDLQEMLDRILDQVEVVLDLSDEETQKYLERHNMDPETFEKYGEIYNDKEGVFVSVPVRRVSVDTKTKYEDKRRLTGKIGNIGFSSSLTSELNLSREDSLETLYNKLESILGSGGVAVDMLKGLNRRGENVELNSTEYGQIWGDFFKKEALEKVNKKNILRELNSTELQNMDEEGKGIAVQLILNLKEEVHENRVYVIGELADLALQYGIEFAVVEGFVKMMDGLELEQPDIISAQSLGNAQISELLIQDLVQGNSPEEIRDYLKTEDVEEQIRGIGSLLAGANIRSFQREQPGQFQELFTELDVESRQRVINAAVKIATVKKKLANFLQIQNPNNLNSLIQRFRNLKVDEDPGVIMLRFLSEEGRREEFKSRMTQLQFRNDLRDYVREVVAELPAKVIPINRTQAKPHVENQIPFDLRREDALLFKDMAELLRNQNQTDTAPILRLRGKVRYAGRNLVGAGTTPTERGIRALTEQYGLEAPTSDIQTTTEELLRKMKQRYVHLLGAQVALGIQNSDELTQFLERISQQEIPILTGIEGFDLLEELIDDQKLKEIAPGVSHSFLVNQRGKRSLAVLRPNEIMFFKQFTSVKERVEAQLMGKRLEREISLSKLYPQSGVTERILDLAQKNREGERILGLVKHFKRRYPSQNERDRWLTAASELGVNRVYKREVSKRSRDVEQARKRLNEISSKIARRKNSIFSRFFNIEALESQREQLRRTYQAALEEKSSFKEKWSLNPETGKYQLAPSSNISFSYEEIYKQGKAPLLKELIDLLASQGYPFGVLEGQEGSITSVLEQFEKFSAPLRFSMAQGREEMIAGLDRSQQQELDRLIGEIRSTDVVLDRLDALSPNEFPIKTFSDLNNFQVAQRIEESVYSDVLSQADFQFNFNSRRVEGFLEGIVPEEIIFDYYNPVEANALGEQVDVELMQNQIAIATDIAFIVAGLSPPSGRDKTDYEQSDFSDFTLFLANLNDEDRENFLVNLREGVATAFSTQLDLNNITQIAEQLTSASGQRSNEELLTQLRLATGLELLDLSDVALETLRETLIAPVQVQVAQSQLVNQFDAQYVDMTRRIDSPQELDLIVKGLADYYNQVLEGIISSSPSIKESLIVQYDGKSFLATAKNLNNLIETLESVGARGKVIVHHDPNLTQAINDIFSQLREAGYGNLLSKIQKSRYPLNLRGSDVNRHSRLATRSGFGSVAYFGIENGSVLQESKEENKLQGDVEKLDRFQPFVSLLNRFAVTLAQVPKEKQAELVSEFSSLGIEMTPEGVLTINLQSLINRITSEYQSRAKVKVAA